MAAVDSGVSVDTTMGFTPLEGLLMGTRSGDIDASMILYIMGKEGLTLSEAGTLLNKHSGLQGISGISSDMREIIAEMKNGDKKATYAFDVFTYRVKKYIGAYAAAMGGVDAVVFTGGHRGKQRGGAPGILRRPGFPRHHASTPRPTSRPSARRIFPRRVRRRASS